MNPATTRTGGYPIGFRRGWSDWQRDLPALASWARQHGFGVLDLGNDGDRHLATLLDVGLRPGSVDLVAWKELISADPAVRATGVAAATAYVERCAAAAAGRCPLNFFVVMLPANPAAPRAENFAHMVESYRALAPVLERHGARLVIEGWPGPGALCCTPESLRAFFRECPSPALGINYDPSHLLRMGIDPVRFLREFEARVFHVHGKDTEIFEEAVYDCGREQPATFARGHGFGGVTWRYTIPGHGRTPWVEVLRVLAASGYAGAVSIELEDENFNGTPESEQRALGLAREFLAGC